MAGSESSIELFERWNAHRDARAFKEIVDRHASLVYSTCNRILRNAIDAEDVTQECFLQLARTRDRITVSLEGWLHTLATRRSVDRIRRDSRRVNREQRYVETDIQVSDANWRALDTEIDEAIEKLPHDLRGPVVAYFLEHQSQEEIGRRLGLSQSAVSRRIDNGVELIRESLRQRGYTVPAVTTLAAYLAGISSDAAPPELAVSLGKIGIAHGASTAVTAFGGLVVMKKTVAIVVVLAAVLAWFFYPREKDNAPGFDPGAAIPTLDELARDTGMSPGTRLDDLNRVDQSSDSNAQTTVTSVQSAQPAANPQSKSGATSGVVYYASSRKPVANQAIQLTRIDDESTQAGTTNPSGEFRFAELNAGEYAVTPLSDSIYPALKPVYVDVSEGESVDDVVLLLPGLGEVEGLITIGGGPEPNLVVDIMLLEAGVNHGAITVTTDEQGRFRLAGIQEGQYQLIAQLSAADDTKTWSNQPSAQVVADEVVEVTLNFAAGEGALAGLASINGKPAAGSRLTFAFYDPGSQASRGTVILVADAEGRYNIEGLEEGRQVVHGAIELGRNRMRYGDAQPIYIPKNGSDTYDFNVTMGTGEITGHVFVGGEMITGGSLGIESELVPIGEDGMYVVENVNPGVKEFDAQLVAAWGHVWKDNRNSVEITEGSPAQLARIAHHVVEFRFSSSWSFGFGVRLGCFVFGRGCFGEVLRHFPLSPIVLIAPARRAVARRSPVGGGAGWCSGPDGVVLEVCPRLAEDVLVGACAGEVNDEPSHGNSELRAELE